MDDDFVMGRAPVTIVSRGVMYEPRCVEVPAGTSVVFEDDFVTHPLTGGQVAGGTGTQDPQSPIPSTSRGTTVTVAFSESGLFGFYCSHHASLGMSGAVRVTRP